MEEIAHLYLDINVARCFGSWRDTCFDDLLSRFRALASRYRSAESDGEAFTALFFSLKVLNLLRWVSEPDDGDRRASAIKLVAAIAAVELVREPVAVPEVSAADVSWEDADSNAESCADEIDFIVEPESLAREHSRRAWAGLLEAAGAAEPVEAAEAVEAALRDVGLFNASATALRRLEYATFGAPVLQLEKWPSEADAPPEKWRALLGALQGFARSVWRVCALKAARGDESPCQPLDEWLGAHV